MNEYNPEGKDIRFIDSHYRQLFRIYDGSYIQIQYPDETVLKPCRFIDEYHTQIGYNVFHICQFAEIMEQNGAIYHAEPDIMGEEAAWKVGKDRIFALQTYEDGYDYTLFDEKFIQIDGGQLDNPELTMIQARTEILESFGMERRELRVLVYEDVMEKSLEVSKQAIAKINSITELAIRLDYLAESFDPYEYRDQIGDGQEHTQKIIEDLKKRNTKPYLDFLDIVIAESKENADIAKQLRLSLEEINLQKKESVMEKLARSSERVVSSKSSLRNKELER